MADSPKTIALHIEIFLARYLIPVFQRKWLVLAFFVLGLTAALTINAFIKPIYVSQATTLVEEPRSNIVSKVNQKVVHKKAESTYVISEVEKLKGESFADEVLGILPDELEEDLRYPLGLKSQIAEGIKEALKALIGERRFEQLKSTLGRKPAQNADFLTKRALITELTNRVKINSKANRALIWIEAKTINKEMAPLLVKSYLDIWMASNLDSNKRGIRLERRFAENQKNEAFDKFQEAETLLLDFKRRYEIPAGLKVTSDIEIQSEMERLQSQLQLARERYQLMDKIYLETRRKESGVVVNLRVVNPPLIPIRPSKNISTKLLILGILGGLAAGIGLALLLDTIKGAIHHQSDITDAVRLEIVGHVPHIGDRRKRAKGGRKMAVERRQ